MENKFKATLSLIFSAAGAAVTYPVISPLSAAVSSDLWQQQSAALLIGSV